MQIHISRDGSEIGVWHQDEALAKYRNGALLATDYAWHADLVEWVRLDGLFPNPTALTVPPAVNSPPATEKQLKFIRSFDVDPPEGVTKKEASILLQALTNDPSAIARQQQKRDRNNRERQLAQEKEQVERESFPSYYCKLEALECRENLEGLEARSNLIKEKIRKHKDEIKTLKAELKLKTEEASDEICYLNEDLQCLPDEIKDNKEDLKEAEANRLFFWKYVFREDMTGEASEEAWKLHDTAGQYFKSPPQKVVTEILSSLDSEDPSWDKTNIEQFFTRLKQIHPELKR